MKPFTDDDSESMKDEIYVPDGALFDGHSVKAIKSLIARLEAAEKVAEYARRHAPRVNELVVLLRAWRKACGK
jgi:hypothetical protein